MAGTDASRESPSPRVFRLAAQVAAEMSAASIVTPEPPPAPGRELASTRVARSLPALSALLQPAYQAPAPRPVVSPRRLPDQLRHPAAVRRGARVRLPGPFAVLVVLFGLFATGVGVENMTGTQVIPGTVSSGSKPPPRESPVLTASQPVGIAIPSLNVRAVVHNVGIAADGTIAVPTLDRASEAGWYDQSPTPGQNGPAVLVGHVDTQAGPAVFHGLEKMRPGDKVEVARQDRTVAVFEVSQVDRFRKSQIPVDQVYGDFGRPNLRLITCGGQWVGGQTGYADNVIVFATLVDAKRS